jgi:pSer/pThr/pTyr-binding forkhead associated (FHA) protein
MTTTSSRGSRGGSAPRWVLGAAALLLLVLSARESGAAGEFRIRKVRNVGKNLLVYHDPVNASAGAKARLRLTRGGCQVDPPLAFVPVQKTEDRHAVLLVLDRGGRSAGMGRYSGAIIGAVRTYLEEELGAKYGDVYALVDSSGSGTTPRSLPPTDDLNALRSFLDQAPKPSDVGADVYGVTTTGLNLLAQNDKPLKAAIVISDGRDPHASGTTAPNQLITRARATDVPIFSIIVDRSNEPADHGYKVKLAAGRDQLKRVSAETNGAEMAVPKADADLQRGILAGLKRFSDTTGTIMRTSCGLCGTAGDPGDLKVQMIVESAGVVAFQSSNAASVADVNVPGLAPCTCTLDEHCGPGQQCRKGVCEESPGKALGGGRRKGPPWWPFALGGALVLVGLVAFVLRSRRAAQREAVRMNEHEAHQDSERAELRDRQAKLESELATERASREAEARARELQVQAARDRERRKKEAEEEALRKQRAKAVFVLRVVHAPEDVPQRFELSQGEHLVGRDVGVAVQIPIAAISAPHARIVVTSDHRIIVQDLQSKNGTYVNGNIIAPSHDKEIFSGDEIKFSRQVTLKLDAANPATESHRSETKAEP